MPADAVLAGLLLIVSFSLSHSVVEVQGIDWTEPVLAWLVVCMPTGSGKSTLCKFLRKIIGEARCRAGNDDEPFWLSDDQSFEKMGELMEENNAKLLGLYDELSMFLSQINVCRGRTLTDSQQVSTFLQLYGADPWVRRTGKPCIVIHIMSSAKPSTAALWVVGQPAVWPVNHKQVVTTLYYDTSCGSLLVINTKTLFLNSSVRRF